MATNENQLSALDRKLKLMDDIELARSNALPNQNVFVKFKNEGKTIWRPGSNVESVISDLVFEVQPTTGSDSVVSDMLIRDLYDAEVITYDKESQGELRGDFYPYLLSEEAEDGLSRCGIDLSPCQIYSEKSISKQLKTNPNHVTKHCLWNSLQQLLPDRGELALCQLGLREVGGVATKKRVLSKIANLYGINIRLYETDEKGDRQSRLYKGSNEKDEINIGLQSGHFFPNIKHSPTTCGKPADISTLISSRQLGGAKHDQLVYGDKHFRSRKGTTISTSNLLIKLLNAGYMKPYNPEITHSLGIARTEALLTNRNPFIQDCFIPNPKLSKPITSKTTPHVVKYSSVFYADFESFVCEKTGRHIPYLACAVSRGGGQVICAVDPSTIKNDANESLGKKLITKICKQADNCNIRIYFHNLRYDANFLYDCGISNIQTVEDDARLYQLQGVFTTNNASFNLSFRDTYSYLSCKLSDFHKMFEIPCGDKWGDFPYDLFTRERLGTLMTPTSQFKDHELARIPSQYKQEPFKVGLYKYAVDYCKQDVLVLQQGFDQFREKALELGVDVDGPMTAASFALTFLEKEGVIAGVDSINGSVRAYVQESVVGGRVCVRGNNPIHYLADKDDRSTHLVDFDAVSLYPSAMASIPGLPLGAPERFEGPPPDDDNFYVATVKVRAIGRELHMSTLSKEIDGVRRWGKGSVSVGDVLVLNRVQIESAQQFQGVVFDFVGGLRWPEGYNPQICNTIKKLFDWRLRLKAEKNPLESVVKLIMNSAYGKFGQKPHDVKVKWIWGEEKKAVAKAAEVGMGFIYLESANRDNTLWKLKYKSPDFKHSNRAHCASLILAQSKHIMYQVTTPLDDEILYTDTDSMILPNGALPKLDRPDLVGKKMGQFHTDLAWVGGGGGEVTAIEGYFLAKKTYALRLENSSAPGETQYHFRAKGIPNSTINATCSKKSVNPMELYKEICEKGVSFDLTLGRPCFKQHPTSIVTMKEFDRKLGPFVSEPSFEPEKTSEEVDKYLTEDLPRKLTLDEQLEIYLNELAESL